MMLMEEPFTIAINDYCFEHKSVPFFEGTDFYYIQNVKDSITDAVVPFLDLAFIFTVFAPGILIYDKGIELSILYWSLDRHNRIRYL